MNNQEELKNGNQEIGNQEELGKSTGAYAPEKALCHREHLQLLKENKPIDPVHIHVVISNSCNLSCRLCSYRTEGYSSNQLFSDQPMLETELVKSVIDDCKEMGTIGYECSLAGDEEIPVRIDSKIKVVSIGKLVDGLLGQEPPESGETEIKEVDTEIRAWGIADDGSLKEGRITHVVRHPARERLFEVTLATGAKVRVTASHSLNLIRDNQIVDVPVKEAVVGDLIACCPDWLRRVEDDPLRMLFMGKYEKFGPDALQIPIKKITSVQTTELVYDISIEGLHRFITVSGIGCHNTGGGSPLTHPDAIPLIQYAQDRGLETALITNGTLMTKEKAAVAVRGTWCRVSVDAATKETYGIVRGSRRKDPQENFERAIKAIALLKEEKDRQQTSCTIGSGFVVQRENWKEIYDACKLYKELGADNVRISGCFTPEGDKYFDGWGEEAKRLEVKAVKDLSSPTFQVYGRLHEKIADLQTRPQYPRCYQQHLCTYLGADANLYRCCTLAYNRQGLLGNVREAGGFKKLWRSQELQDKLFNFDARSCNFCQHNDKNAAISSHLDEGMPECPGLAKTPHRYFV